MLGQKGQITEAGCHRYQQKQECYIAHSCHLGQLDERAIYTVYKKVYKKVVSQKGLPFASKMSHVQFVQRKL